MMMIGGMGVLAPQIGGVRVTIRQGLGIAKVGVVKMSCRVAAPGDGDSSGGSYEGGEPMGEPAKRTR